MVLANVFHIFTRKQISNKKINIYAAFDDSTKQQQKKNECRFWTKIKVEC